MYRGVVGRLAAKLGWARRLGRRARNDESGVAFMEFALTLPFLTMSFLGGVELVNLTVKHQQMSRIATTTADLAARFRSSIDETDVETLFLGARLALKDAEFDERGRVILSAITAFQPDGDGNSNGHQIRWQRCDGDYDIVSTIGGEGWGVDEEGEPTGEIPLVHGMEVLWPNTVMFAEVTYVYEPIFGAGGFLSDISEVFEEREISYRAAFIARELSLQTITNTTNIPEPDLSTCPQPIRGELGEG
ncbi:pilus assembly protein [Pacificimonas sp. WHA3]|uniref:Pilus assembly protein n=1 Tax=Pacificimonas pallii TaxID=2827236 RepID=A0ABS6SFM9_9SPHN|nr:TadE/TadG family type IV pilus assembly protein [Pacificimonas pallii]MBV7256736.1 pilus assembly protein [Pacificimonas pallii]